MQASQEAEAAGDPTACGCACSLELSAAIAPRSVWLAFVTAALHAEAFAKTKLVPLTFWHDSVLSVIRRGPLQ